MTAALNKLEKVLELEVQRGCEDRAVIGGLERFLAHWLEEYGHTTSTSGKNDLISQLKIGTTRYSSMDINSRYVWLNGIIDTIKKNKPGIVAPDTVHPLNEKKADPKKQPRPVDFDIESPVSHIKGVSSAMASKLSRLGVNSIKDLMYHFPNRHLDYSCLKTICGLVEGFEETIIANVWEARQIDIKGRRSTEATLGDKTGNIRVVWFNNPYIARSLTPGKNIVISGKVKIFGSRPVFESPDWEFFDENEELVHTGRLVPVYPLTKGLYQRQLRKILKTALDEYLHNVIEFLPENILKKNGMREIRQAISNAHFPASLKLKNQARTRLAFNELFLLQLGVLRKKKHWEAHTTSPIPPDKESLISFVKCLPFSLTAAQKRVVAEILNDLNKNKPMARLLQGEVGSGKTVVALIAILMAVNNGRQCSLMAPTEVLAVQHFKSITSLLGNYVKLKTQNDFVFEFASGNGGCIRIALLTSDIKSSIKKEIIEGIKSGNINIVIGTHAIIQGEISFYNLGLAVIDEQHRFGVVQRQALRHKGDNPHILVMTATPIPRTLALTLYGDLDLSIIDSLPPGRQIIKTRWLKPEERHKAYNFIHKQINTGSQVFIICPLVEESEALQARAATAEFKHLSREVFPGFKLGLLHGRMKSGEKEKVMREFYEGSLDILVTTPVVEVGIDVPNATVILIESANRFGLSQLHQFRGRVGRGKHQSYCMLISESITGTGAERLKAIEEIHDGFKLAEKDLQLRGPGEFFGTRQSGLPDLKMAKLSDVLLLEKARREAELVFKADADLPSPKHRLMYEELLKVWTDDPAERS